MVEYGRAQPDYDAEKAALGITQVHVQDEKRSVGNIFYKALTAGRVEERGIQPVQPEHRTLTRYITVLGIWLSINTNIFGVMFGMLGPVTFGLSLRNSALVIVFFNILCALAPAYLSTLGPKTGMRQLIQARFSFGYYLVTIPALLNLASQVAAAIIIFVIGGQCLSAVADGRLTQAVGIVITALGSLLLSFCGIRLLHSYERYAWIPATIACIIVAGCGGTKFKQQTVPDGLNTAAQVFSFAGVIASYVLPWGVLASDQTGYFDPQGRHVSWRLFTYTFLGNILPNILTMALGAAIGGAIPNVPEWEAGFEKTMVGGALAAVLIPAGGFGKFVVVVLAFTLVSNIAGAMYTLTLNFQMIVPFYVPRYFFSVVLTVISTPIAIKASDDFFQNLNNFISLIGYWCASFVGIVLAEHFVFQRAHQFPYDIRDWNNVSALPIGLAAIGTMIASFGLIVPCMAQVWWTGPIAAKTGDIGFEVAFVLSTLLYGPFRWTEKRFIGR